MLGYSPRDFAEIRRASEAAKEYFLRRERTERAAADKASSPFVQAIHLEMARRYASKAGRCRNGAISSFDEHEPGRPFTIF